MQDIEAWHANEASQAISSELLRRDLFDKMSEIFAQQRQNLHTCAIPPGIKCLDGLLGIGEHLSSLIFSHVLLEHHLNAHLLDSVNLLHGDESKHVSPSFFEKARSSFRKTLIDMYNTFPSVVPVVGGFFGPVPGGMIASIGRGYTDLTASMISCALSCKELRIYKEVPIPRALYSSWNQVDGIFTSDPRKVPKAKLLAEMTPMEVQELTTFGSEVVHSLVISQTSAARVPIRILNTFKPELSGTVIPPRKTDFLQLDGKEDRKCATAATVLDDITLLTVRSSGPRFTFGILSDISSTLKR